MVVGQSDVIRSPRTNRDPEGNVPIDDEYQPEDYLINSALYDTIHLATDKQLPGVDIEAEDSEDEDGAGELGDEGVPSGDEIGGGNGGPQGELKRRAPKAKDRDVQGWCEAIPTKRRFEHGTRTQPHSYFPPPFIFPVPGGDHRA